MNIASCIRALARRRVRGASPRRDSLSRRLGVEALEDRTVPSSVKLLPLGDGTFQLRVDGDAKPNQISIVGSVPVTQTNDYSLLVTCDKLTQTVDHVSEVIIDTAGGDDGVLLTGQWSFQAAGQKTPTGVRSISIKTGGGNDEVKFTDFDGQSLNGNLPGPHIQIDTGSGNDLAWFRPIFHPPTLFLGLNLTVNSGEGDDSVLVENLAFAAPSAADAPASRISIVTAGGDDAVTLNGWQGTAALDVGPVGGGVDLWVATGAGRDTLLMHDNNLLAGALQAYVDLSSGNDKATFEDNVFGGGLSLAITGGTGADLVTITCNGMGPVNFLADLGSGDDVVTLTENTFGGTVQLAVNGGTGNNRIEIGGDGDAGMMEGNLFGGALSLAITGGTGNDLVLLQCDEIKASFSASIDLGSGNDSATFSENDVTGLSQMSINGGDGNDVVEIGSEHEAAMAPGTHWGGGLSLAVTGGAGNDLVAVQENSIGVDSGAPADVRVDLGSGNDVVTMHDNQVGADLWLIATGGTGNDFAVVQFNQIKASFNSSIDLGSGNDAAVFTKNSVNGLWQMSVLGGVGNDLVAVQDNRAGSVDYMGIPAAFDAAVDLGKGDDTALFAGNTVIGSRHMTIFGDTGNDLVTLLCNGIGAVDVLVDLGSGRDIANIDLTLDNLDPVKQPVNIKVMGGAGDDYLALSVKTDPQVLAAATLFIDGGPGFDHGVVGPFVRTINCEN